MRKEVNQTRDEFWNLAILLFSKKIKDHNNNTNK